MSDTEATHAECQCRYRREYVTNTDTKTTGNELANSGMCERESNRLQLPLLIKMVRAVCLDSPIFVGVCDGP